MAPWLQPPGPTGGIRGWGGVQTPRRSPVEAASTKRTVPCHTKKRQGRGARRGHQMSKIIIVGSGVVGSATGKGLAKAGHEVTFVDVDPARLEALREEGHEATDGL